MREEVLLIKLRANKVRYVDKDSYNTKRKSVLSSGRDNNDYKLIQGSFDNFHKRSVSNFATKPIIENKSMDNRMYCEVSVSQDKGRRGKQYQHSNSFPYPRVDSNSRHYCSHNSLENRNLIVNVQVMGKKQEIITYQSFKDPLFNHGNIKANNYVLA